MDCVFCAIVDGQLPAHLLHEDEHFLVLLDIFPLRPVTEACTGPARRGCPQRLTGRRPTRKRGAAPGFIAPPGRSENKAPVAVGLRHVGDFLGRVDGFPCQYEAVQDRKEGVHHPRVARVGGAVVHVNRKMRCDVHDGPGTAD